MATDPGGAGAGGTPPPARSRPPRRARRVVLRVLAAVHPAGPGRGGVRRRHRGGRAARGGGDPARTEHLRRPPGPGRRPDGVRTDTLARLPRHGPRIGQYQRLPALLGAVHPARAPRRAAHRRRLGAGLAALLRPGRLPAHRRGVVDPPGVVLRARGQVARPGGRAGRRHRRAGRRARRARTGPGHRRWPGPPRRRRRAGHLPADRRGHTGRGRRAQGRADRHAALRPDRVAADRARRAHRVAGLLHPRRGQAGPHARVEAEPDRGADQPRHQPRV